MGDKVRIAGVEESRAQLPSILRSAHLGGTVTIVTKRGVPYAAVVPVLQAVREAPKLAELRGSAEGCLRDAGRFVEGLRDEWH